MYDKRQRFLKILQIEMEYLECYAEDLSSALIELKKKREVTEHVCRENVAVFRNEECCFRHYRRIIDNIDFHSYDNLEDMIKDLKQKFQDEQKRSDLVHAAYVCAAERIDAIYQFIMNNP